MDSAQRTPYQNELIQRPINRKLFLEGPAGSGKTTTGIERMLFLMRSGIPAGSLLLLVPQRTLAQPYLDALEGENQIAGGQVSILTVGGLARRMVDLFWPLVAREAGFTRPDRPPSFLTLETALYYMAHLVRPLLDQGFFDSVTIDRNRIYSQILDNLNKAAIVGFSYAEIGERLQSAWLEDTTQTHIYADAQYCATLFREYCLQNNLLDFSLQMELFTQHLWQTLVCQDYLSEQYRHLIADNIEEDTPAAHNLIREWLPAFDSALLIYDQEAGYRRFLGADPDSGFNLVDGCDEHHVFTDSLAVPPKMENLCAQFGRALERPIPSTIPALPSDELSILLRHPERPLRFFPQMLDWVASEVSDLINEGVPPGDIVILAPLLPDSLRFSLTTRLAARKIPYRTHRPSRSLREEPAAQALLTLGALAHPGWGVRPSEFEVAYTFVQTIQGMDLVRAQLLVDAAYRGQAEHARLLPFERIRPEVQERITYSLGARYETLRAWLDTYAAEPDSELDFFFSRLFGEVLSQSGFAFHSNLEAGTISANLIESAQKFRWAVEGRLPAEDEPEAEEPLLGEEYLHMIQDGVLAAQYVQSWQIPPDDAVLIAPAYTYLLANQPVDHQFWLDVGSSSWSERLYQPLTHPYVLSRSWKRGQVWTDVDEFEYSQDTLYRLVLGLARRCRKHIHLGLCELGEGGYESRGMLLRAVQMAMMQSRGDV